MKLTIPTEVATGTLNFAVETLNDPGMLLFLEIIIGTLLAVVVIEILINALRPK